MRARETDRPTRSARRRARSTAALRIVAALALLSLAALAPLHTGHDQPAPAAAGCVALTFDDGPDVALTPMLLSILEREGVPATFFVVGQRVAANPGILRRLQADGHEIGNHTWDHRLLPGLADDDLAAEIVRTDAAVVAVTGRRPELIRPPYGISSEAVETLLKSRGLMRPMALWDTDALDWLEGDEAGVVRAASQAAAGSVVLMHDIHPATIQAVPEVIRRLRARGLRLTTFSGLAACLNASPPPGRNGPRLAAQGVADTAARQGDAAAPSAGRLIGTMLSWRRAIERGG